MHTAAPLRSGATKRRSRVRLAGGARRSSGESRVDPTLEASGAQGCPARMGHEHSSDPCLSCAPLAGVLATPEGALPARQGGDEFR